MAPQFFLDNVIDKLSQSLPAVFARKEVVKLLGNSISAGTLANLQSQGLGPASLRNGRNAIYERESFLAWFKIYLTGGIKAIKEQKGIKDE